jgi:hypothetical protein
MGLADAMAFTRIKQDALCGRCLTGVNMSHDADVARLLK